MDKKPPIHAVRVRINTINNHLRVLESARRRHDSVADRHRGPESPRGHHRARRGQLHNSDLLLVTLASRRGRRRLDLCEENKILWLKSI